MMFPATLVLLLLPAAGPQDDLDRIDREFRTVEKERDQMRIERDRALSQNDKNRAADLDDEIRRKETDLHQLRRRRQQILDRGPLGSSPARDGISTLERIRIEVGGLWTAYDDDLEIEDGFTYFARASAPLSTVWTLSITTRGGDLDGDEISGETVGVLAGTLDLSYTLPIDSDADWTLSAGINAGLLHLKSDADGESDSAILIALEGSLSWRPFSPLRLRPGILLEALNADFRGDRDWFFDFGFLLAIEFEF